MMLKLQNKAAREEQKENNKSAIQETELIIVFDFDFQFELN